MCDVVSVLKGLGVLHIRIEVIIGFVGGFLHDVIVLVGCFVLWMLDGCVLVVVGVIWDVIWCVWVIRAFFLVLVLVRFVG